MLPKKKSNRKRRYKHLHKAMISNGIKAVLKWASNKEKHRMQEIHCRILLKYYRDKTIKVSKLLLKIQRNRTTPSSLCKDSITLIPKLNKDSKITNSYLPFLVIISAKILKIIRTTEMNNIVKRQ